MMSSQVGSPERNSLFGQKRRYTPLHNTQKELYVGRSPNWRSEIKLERMRLSYNQCESDHSCGASRNFRRSNSLGNDSVSSFFEDRSYSAPERRKWNAGKISVIMLVLFTMTDFLFHMVNAQIDSLGSDVADYDALSPDVIRPAFRYAGTEHSSKPRLGLGSAAISSVTTTLSPILPFAGGIDLRREDYWTNGWFGSVFSIYEHLRVAFQAEEDDSVLESSSSLPSPDNIPRGGAAVAQKPHKRRKVKHALAIGASEPFIPLKEVSAMTLREVAVAFRYAIENTRSEFAPNKFMKDVTPRVRKVLDQISQATSKSRGAHALPARTGIEGAGAGDMDALYFCAAMRCFADWRILRQVPEGYKGYAVGMSLGQKDIIQNVAKIESAVHAYVDSAVTMASESVASPTLRELLRYEIDQKIQNEAKLPRLAEKSAGMGLLWVRRQLNYQTATFKNVLAMSNSQGSAKEAVTAAYAEVYDRYHGWAVQKIFNYSFQAAPDASEIFRTMNPEKLQVMMKKSEGISSSTSTSGSSKQNRQESNNPLDRFGRHVAKEWSKVADTVVHVFDGKSRSNRPSYHLDLNTDDGELEKQQFIDDAMQKDAHEHIMTYLEIAQPLLEDLATLFAEFNMDDPTKV